jgi:DNA-binding SARP family transcriptional activator
MADTATPQVAATLEISLVDGFELDLAGRRLDIAPTAERLIAYLALAGHPVHRTRLAGVLWLDASEHAAASSLRTALWRLRRAGVALRERRDGALSLPAGTRVDLDELSEIARRLRVARPGDALAGLGRLVRGTELLPDWDAEWVATDRERYRFLRLGALEHAAEILLARSEPGSALDAALAALGAEPLRESAMRLLVRAHLAEGNVADALVAYSQYRDLLRSELGVRPSRAMEALIAPLATGARG